MEELTIVKVKINNEDKFAAWNFNPLGVPVDSFMGDNTENFWKDADDMGFIVGIGNTPNEALSSLNDEIEKVKAIEKSLKDE